MERNEEEKDVTESTSRLRPVCCGAWSATGAPYFRLLEESVMYSTSHMAQNLVGSKHFLLIQIQNAE